MDAHENEHCQSVAREQSCAPPHGRGFFRGVERHGYVDMVIWEYE